MKKILLSMAAVAALGAAAVPAAAQPWRGDDYRHSEGQRFTGRYDALEWQIRNAADERRMSRGEANELLRMWRDAQPLAWRVETGRASGWERQRVYGAMNRIENALQRSNRYDRADRYDRGDRYDDGYGRRDWRR